MATIIELNIFKSFIVKSENNKHRAGDANRFQDLRNIIDQFISDRFDPVDESEIDLKYTSRKTPEHVSEAQGFSAVMRIVERKKDGIDPDESESYTIKSWLKTIKFEDWIGAERLEQEIINLFPHEFNEVAQEINLDL